MCEDTNIVNPSLDDKTYGIALSHLERECRLNDLTGESSLHEAPSQRCWASPSFDGRTNPFSIRAMPINGKPVCAAIVTFRTLSYAGIGCSSRGTPAFHLYDEATWSSSGPV